MKRVLVSLVAVAALAFAGQGDYKSELTATVGGVKPEGNLDLANQLNLGLRYGVHVQNKIFDMVEAGFERASSVNYDNSNEDTNINRFFVDIVKEYDLNKQTALYSLVGVGYEDYTNPQFNNDDDGFFQYGVGVKRWITDQFALKAEVRHGITFGGDNNLFYNLGFVVPFGKKVQEKMPMKSEPVVVAKKPEPKPVIVKKVPKDDDKDGVINANDKCPTTPEAIRVDAMGCPYDNDKDGVINEYDQCMTTPAGRVVNESGCMYVVQLHVNFETNKANVASTYNDKIKEVVDFMNDNKKYSVVLEGHTDSRGSMKYNQTLSEKRATAVQNVLVNDGISANRISTMGYGETKPVASNDTKEGRAKNRRVEASFNR